MERTLYRSIEEMTRPETLSTLVQQPITTTRLAPFQTVGRSTTESQFLAVNTNNSDQPHFVLKRIAPERDWVMQMTDDQHWRQIAIWQQGLLDRLPEEIDPAIVACSVDGEGYALLMRNITHTLVSNGALFSEMDNELNVDAMAALHATFWEHGALQNPDLNLCSPENLFTHTAPEKMQGIKTNNSTAILDIALEGWQLLSTFLDADVVDLLGSLARNPSPLCNALSNYPQTLVHGDWHLPNFGIENGERSRLVLFDWARPTPTVPAVDLAYYLVTSSRTLPVSREATIALYKQRLADRLGDRFDESWWQPQLELSLLGAFLMIGCFKAWGATHSDDENRRMHDQADLVWWPEQIRAGARWLAL